MKVLSELGAVFSRASALGNRDGQRRCHVSRAWSSDVLAGDRAIE
jgi:hypothetical protein